MQTYETILADMQQAYREQTGFEADNASDIGIRLRVLAEQVALLYQELEELEQQSFPQSSTGEALERHAECRGLYRKPARPAQGMLRFSRQSPAPVDIPVSVGVICATRSEPSIQFITTADAVLPAGETEVLVPAQAETAGSSGNIAPGAVTLMVSAAAGISTVGNPESFSGGVDAESDDALRTRLLYAYSHISNGANAAFYYDLAMNREGVRSAAVLPRARGRGTVDVVIHSSGEQDEILDGLADEMMHQREVNVDVQVYAATEQSIALTAAVAIDEGADYSTVQAACAAVIRAHIEQLGVGQPLLLARLTRELLDVDGVYNASVQTPAKDIRPLADAVLRPGAIFVERMSG